MSYKSIKRLCRDAVKADFESTFATELSGVQVVSTFTGSPFQAQNIRVTTENAVPERAGLTNLGRWMVTVRITAMTVVDDYTSDQHDNLSGMIEAYVLQDNRTLAAALSGSELTVDNVLAGNGEAEGLDGINDTRRMSSQTITLEAYIPTA